jgi:hypothetical protein
MAEHGGCKSSAADYYIITFTATVFLRSVAFMSVISLLREARTEKCGNGNTHRYMPAGHDNRQSEKDHPGKVWQDRTLCLSSMRREVESGNHIFATK